MKETDDLHDYCTDVILLNTEEFCFLWNTGYSEPKIKQDYNDNNNRVNPLSYLGDNVMINQQVSGGGVEDFIGVNDHHKDLITIVIHLRLGDVKDCGNQRHRSLRELELLQLWFDGWLDDNFLRELKCGSSGWSEKHPSPAYINDALALVDEALKVGSARIAIVSDASTQEEFDEIQKIIDYAHGLNMAHHIDPADEDSTKVLFLDADAANPEQALDALATEADICIVGGSSFAFLATLFGRCATIVPSGVSFVEEFSEVIDARNGQPLDEQSGYLAHRSILLPSPDRKAGSSYFGSGTTIADGQEMSNAEREIAVNKLTEVLRSDVKVNVKLK